MSRATKNLVVTLLLSVASIGLSTSWACDEAEKLRLADEIQSLAQKNAWGGVERKYTEILKTKCDINPKIQLIAADSALSLGKTYERWERLAAANALEPTEAVTEALKGIEINYGRVQIKGDPRRRAPLLRESMPFAPDQRKSIEWAQKVVEGTGSFKGMLPAGEYKVSDRTFHVVPGTTEFFEVQIGKTRKNQPPDGGEKPVRDGDQPLINWSGPVASVGFSFFGTPAPQKATVDTGRYRITGPAARGTGDVVCPNIDDPDISDDDRIFSDTPGEEECYVTIRQPGTIGMFSTPAIDVSIGYEVGLTYRKPEMGAVVMLTYRKPFTGLHQATVFGGWMMRPGRLRFTAGPTWNVVLGSGAGYVGWVDEGQSMDFRDGPQTKTERYVGWGYGGGVAGSAGYAALDVAGFQGIIELHGHWMADNRRTYQGVGIRFGIVPKIKRFEE